MTDLAMHNVSLNSEDGALLFVADTVQEADDFLFSLISTMFAPGGRPNTTLTVESSNNGFFFYQVDSENGYAELNVEGVSPETAQFIQRSIERRGALLMLFGGYEDGELILLNPRENSLFRAYGVIDGVSVSGQGDPIIDDILDALDQFPHRSSTHSDDLP
ncbi:MAG: hypothetical protein LBK42_05910 [Propionibacteriaceae bacterium]|jgi:hypothetical protein|nr:hypothetical protein [Propionibacteriaceae bacterium]